MVKARWEKRRLNYTNCQHLEATLHNQLTTAFDYNILDGLRNHITNTVTSSIPAIIKYLFEEYGELAPDDLLAKEDDIKNYLYDPALPVSVF